MTNNGAAVCGYDRDKNIYWQSSKLLRISEKKKSHETRACYQT